MAPALSFFEKRIPYHLQVTGFLIFGLNCCFLVPTFIWVWSNQLFAVLTGMDSEAGFYNISLRSKSFVNFRKTKKNFNPSSSLKERNSQ